ncbi:MAG: flagellar biosynthesis anti-sigma factor FlgM [Usitatibacteraceae bacterium]
MRIGNPSDLYRTGAPSGGAAPVDADKTKASASPAQSSTAQGSATVSLSGGLGTLKADLDGDEAFDANRVATLKAAVDGGTFKVNAEAVADKLIASNVEALTRAKR